MAHVPSKAERALSSSLPALLAGSQDGEEIEATREVYDFLNAVAFFLAEEMSEQCPTWPRFESLDGILPSLFRRLGPREVEFAGMAIVISDQTTAPVYGRIRCADDGEQVERYVSKLGEADSDDGEIIRHPYDSRGAIHKRHSLPEQLETLQ